jgi:preprotein translocase subunit SecE
MATRAVKMSGEDSQGGAGSELTKKVTGTVANTREFLHDVRVEMKQVTWPSREDVVATTWVVVATVAFFGVFLWLVDLGVQRGVQYIFKKFGV